MFVSADHFGDKIAKKPSQLSTTSFHRDLNRAQQHFVIEFRRSILCVVKMSPLEV